jgi:hypothetical protein
MKEYEVRFTVRMRMEALVAEDAIQGAEEMLDRLKKRYPRIDYDFEGVEIAGGD